MSFSSVNQMTPDGGFLSNIAVESNNNPFIQIGSTTSEKIVLDILAASPSAGFFAAATGQTVCRDENDETTCTRGRRFFSTAYDVGASGTKIGTANSTVMSWTMSSVDFWAIGAVAINPVVSTAAGVAVSGRALSSSGRGINRAQVILSDSNGETRTVFTNSFGYYYFEAVPAGETYILDVKAKHNTFAPQVVVINEETNELNFTAASEGKQRKR